MASGDNNRRLSDSDRDLAVSMYITRNADGTWNGCKVIARHFGVHHNTIQQLLAKRRIEKRTAKEAHAHGKRCKPVTIVPVGEAPLCGCGCGERTEWLQTKRRWRQFGIGHRDRRLVNDKTWLSEQVGSGVLTADIAKAASVTMLVVLYRMRKFGITRSRSDAHRGLQMGAANPSWKGGVTPLRQRLAKTQEWKDLVAEAFKRDGYHCQRCGAAKVGGTKLHAHHITPFADSVALRFKIDNLLTLCDSCHAWVHSKRNTEREFLA